MIRRYLAIAKNIVRHTRAMSSRRRLGSDGAVSKTTIDGPQNWVHFTHLPWSEHK